MSQIKPRYSPEWVKENIGSFSTLVHKRFDNIPDNYDYPAKDSVRRQMVQFALAHLPKGKPIRIFCLPGVCCVCLFEFGQRFTIDPANSLAVEYNDYYYAHLISWVEAASQLVGGEPLQNLSTYHGYASLAAAEITGVYEVANLDFNCEWNSEVVGTLKNLFRNNRLAIPGILFLTLNDSERYRSRAGMTAGQSIKQIFHTRVWITARDTEYTPHYRYHLSWESPKGSKMVTFFFVLHPKEKIKRKDQTKKTPEANS